MREFTEIVKWPLWEIYTPTLMTYALSYLGIILVLIFVLT